MILFCACAHGVKSGISLDTGRFPVVSYRRLEKRYLQSVQPRARRLMHGCKETVHVRSYHWLATSAGFTVKVPAWPTAQVSGDGRSRPLVTLRAGLTIGQSGQKIVVILLLRLVYRFKKTDNFGIYCFWVTHKNWTKQHHALWPKEFRACMGVRIMFSRRQRRNFA